VTPHAQAERQPRGDTAREKARWGGIGAWVLTLVALPANQAYAGCWRVTRVDPITPTGTVRVCKPDANGGCGTALFEGTLALGDARDVCVARQTPVCQEYDTSLNAYAPPTQAVCDGADAEL
jgi:hypothetical protein